jgi:hypothetical protein
VQVRHYPHLHWATPQSEERAISQAWVGQDQGKRGNLPGTRGGGWNVHGKVASGGHDAWCAGDERRWLVVGGSRPEFGSSAVSSPVEGVSSAVAEFPAPGDRVTRRELEVFALQDHSSPSLSAYRPASVARVMALSRIALSCEVGRLANS